MVLVLRTMNNRQGRELTERQHRERETHGVVLVRRQEEHAVPEPAPDKDISNNASNQVRRVESNSTNPIQGRKVPRQRASNSANVDSTGRGRMAEVSEAQVEEVDHQQQLGKPEVAAHPQVDEAEEQQVGGDVVGADVGGGAEVGCVRGPERPGVD